MDIKVEDTSSTRKTVKVELSLEEVQLAEKDLVKDFMRHASIPGFRKGKAPENIVRSKYSKEIKDELTSSVIKKAYQAAEKGTEFDFYSVVDASPDAPVSSSESATISFKIDILPEFTLPEYKGVEVSLSPVSVSEDEIQNTVNSMTEQRADYKVVDAPAQKGNYVKLSYEGKIDGQLISEIAPDKTIYGTQANTWEEAGAEDAPGVKAVIDGILGLKAGDQSIFPMQFPEDFEVAELAGKSAEYHVTIHEVREKELPDIDEEFLKTLGVESEDEMRSKIKEQLTKQKENDQNYEAKDKILAFLTDNTDFDIPQSAIDSATNSILFRQMSQMLRYGMTQENMESMKDIILEKAADAAQSQAKQLLMLQKIAKEESIEINNQDISMRVMHEAQSAGMDPDKFVQELKKDRARIDDIREATLAAKVLDFLHKNANIQNKEESASKDS